MCQYPALLGFPRNPVHTATRTTRDFGNSPCGWMRHLQRQAQSRLHGSRPYPGLGAHTRLGREYPPQTTNMLRGRAPPCRSPSCREGHALARKSLAEITRVVEHQDNRAQAVQSERPHLLSGHLMSAVWMLLRLFQLVDDWPHISHGTVDFTAAMIRST